MDILLISLYRFTQVVFLHFKNKKNLNNWKIFKGVWYLDYSLYHLWFCAFQTINNTLSSKNLSQWSYINLFLAIQAISETNTNSFWLAVTFIFYLQVLLCICFNHIPFGAIPTDNTLWFQLPPFNTFRHPHTDKLFGRTVIQHSGIMIRGDFRPRQNRWLTFGNWLHGGK